MEAPDHYPEGGPSQGTVSELANMTCPDRGLGMVKRGPYEALYVID